MNQPLLDIQPMPQDPEAEKAVIGAMILSPVVIPTVITICKEEHFYREAHRRLFKAILSMHNRKEPLDIVTLTNELKRMSDFEVIGGTSALTAYIDGVPTAGNVEYYARIVKDKSVRRQIILFTHKLKAEAFSEASSAPELITSVKQLTRQALENLNQLVDVDDSSASLAQKVKDELQESWNGNGLRFVKTGFNLFDQEIGGLERKKFHLITGLPGSCKSTLIQQMTNQMALNGLPVGYACLDTDSKDIHLRMLCQLVKVDYKSIWSPNLSRDKKNELLSRLEMLSDYPTRIVGEEQIGRTFETFASWAWNAVIKQKVQCVFVDSAAKFSIPLDRGQTLESGITRLANDLNSLSKELDIPIVSIHELNRGEVPSPKGSGTWEYVARYWYNLVRDSDRPNVIRMEIRKNSNGLKGTNFNFISKGEYFLLEEMNEKS